MYYHCFKIAKRTIKVPKMLIYQPSLKGYLIFKQSLTIDVGGGGLPPICKLKNFLNNLVHVFNLTISPTPCKHIEAGIYKMYLIHIEKPVIKAVHSWIRFRVIYHRRTHLNPYPDVKAESEDKICRAGKQIQKWIIFRRSHVKAHIDLHHHH